MAAEGYARLTGQIAAVCVTSGPGGTNALTGVMGGWVDSIPMLILSGQIKYSTTVRSTGLALRQLGDQEFDITRAVSTMTKYAEMVIDPLRIRYHLEKALYVATHGRKGPCWLDIPLNVQGAVVDTDDLAAYDPAEDCISQTPPDVTPQTARKVLQLIREAKRPVLLAGAGIRLANAHADFLRLIDRLNVPVTTPWNSHDNIWNDHPLYAGRPGIMGERAGNFILQNSDLLLSIGSRLSIRQVSYDWDNFARDAYQIMVDIDPLELAKPTLRIDLPIHADAGDFIRALLRELDGQALPPKTDWLRWCGDKVKRYAVCLPEYWEKAKPVNPYCFMDTLFKQLPEGQTVVCGNGSACVITFQAAYLKKGQRLFHNSGCASMGYGLPASIGACFGSGKKKTICLEGDGSIQMNLQELQTVVHHHLPVIIFLLNNNGYESMRITQTLYFDRPYVGVDPESGISFPDMSKISNAYGIDYCRISDIHELEQGIWTALSHEGPFMCEVMLDPSQFFSPKLSSKQLPDGRMISAPLEDMAPFLPRDEFRDDMIIPPKDED